MIDTQRDHLPPWVSMFASPAHWLCVYALLEAMLSRHGAHLSRRALLIWGACALPLHLWFVFVQPSIPARTLLMNVTVPVLFAIALPGLMVDVRRMVDRILAWLVAAMVVSYPVRLAIFFANHQVRQLEGKWFWSDYILIFYLVVTVMAVLCALTLMLAIGMDIVEQHHRLAATDPLTGLGNRRALVGATGPDGRRARRWVAALMIDLDRFKAINDTHGHAGGDAVLIAVARALLAQFGDRCLVTRIGGEEFAVLIPRGCDESPAHLALAARIAVAAAKPAPPFEEIRVTASIGYAARLPGERFDDVFRRADVALYKAKNAGRDRVVAADGPEIPMQHAA